MKKLIFSLLLLFAIVGFSFADKTIVLAPGWNVVSTPKLLSGINFSNGGSGISFYGLSGSSWISIVPNIQTIKPLEGFVANNSTTGDVTMSLIYKTNVNPMEILFQKTLNIGWNLLGITNIIEPFANINYATMAIDFTRSGISNLTNKINNNFTISNSPGNLTDLDGGEAYGVFLSSSSIYGGSQNLNNNTGIQIEMIRDTGYNTTKIIDLDSNYNDDFYGEVLWAAKINVQQGVSLGNLTVTLDNGSGYSGTLNDLAQDFDYLTLSINNQSVATYIPVGSTSSTFIFTGNFYIDSTKSLKISGLVKDNAHDSKYQISSISESNFGIKRYSDGDDIKPNEFLGYVGGIQTTILSFVSSLCSTPENVLACALDLDTCPIECSILSVVRNDNLSNTNILAGTSNTTGYAVKLGTNQENGIRIRQFKLDVAGTGFLNNVNLTLYISGVAIQTKTVTSNLITFDSFSKYITIAAPLNVLVKADFAESFSTGTFQLMLHTDGLNAEDMLTSQSITGYTTPSGAIFTIATAIGTLGISNNNPSSTLLLSPSSVQTIIAFKVTATNDDVRLCDIIATGTNLDKLNNFRLTSMSGTALATATTATATGITFTNISNAPIIVKNTSAHYYITADVNSNTTGFIDLTVITGGTKIRLSNGATLNMSGINVTSRTHVALEDTLFLAMVANPNKFLTTSALRFTATAAGKSSVEMTGLVFYNLFAGYTGNMVLAIYKNTVSAGNLAGTGLYTGGVITLTTNNIIDAGSTINYIVAIEGALIDPIATISDRSVSLTNVAFGGLVGSTYYNVGAFPFTSVK